MSDNDENIVDAFDLRDSYPPRSALQSSEASGMPIGRFYGTKHDLADRVYAIPPSLQRQHIAHLAHSGEGKTTTAQLACLHNAQATAGLDFVVDPKGGFADEFLPMWFQATGSLDEITVIDAATALPRLPLFDLRPYLSHPEINISRQRLIEIVVDAAIGVLEAASFDSAGFREASQSIELLRSILFGLFHSRLDRFSIKDLLSELNRIAEGTFSVGVSDSRFQQLLHNMANDDAKMRRALANGAMRRLSPLVRNSLTADAFGTPPTDPDNQLDFFATLDSDEVLIFDLGGLPSFRRELLARVIISRFFIAGRLRQRSDQDTHPLANLYLDEAHTFGNSKILLDILSEGRAFDVGLYLMSQLFSQFGEEARAHISGNIGTLVVGQSDPLAAQAALDHRYSEIDAKRITGTIPIGDWLVRTRSPRGEQPFDPFVVGAMPLPKGHPDSEYPVDDNEQASCDEAIRSMYERSKRRPDVVSDVESTSTKGMSDAEIARGLQHTLWTVPLPDGIEYHEQTDTVRCSDDNLDETFSPTFEGVCDAVRTARRDSSLEDVDLPVTEIGLQVDPWDVKTAPVTLRQLMFLRLIEKAQRRAIDSRAWDIVTETMRPLRDEVGCTSADETELKEMGLISLQDELRGKYYHLTDEGRRLLRDLRNGADPPEPKYGDANESAAHIKGVEIAARALGELAQRPSSPVHRVERYWSPPDERTRLDLVGLDVNDRPVVTVEVERPTNDLNTGVPADYDAMADCVPSAAVWLVANRALGHRVVTALVGSSKHEARIPLDPAEIKSSSTPLDRYSFSAPGCTAIRTYSAVTPELFDQLIVEGEKD
jgi:DNA-binding transcriptional ArsR family regulator